MKTSAGYWSLGQDLKPGPHEYQAGAPAMKFSVSNEVAHKVTLV